MIMILQKDPYSVCNNLLMFFRTGGFTLRMEKRPDNDIIEDLIQIQKIHVR